MISGGIIMKTQYTGLWYKDNYCSGLQYSIGKYITEYDIEKANISVLYAMGVLDKPTYDMLYKADKQYREVYIGKMQRKDPFISQKKAEGIRWYRKKFIEDNNIPDNRILAIKNDAIYVIGEPCNKRQFDDLINFRIANVYTVFAKVGKLELYYGFDPINGTERIDVKGINDAKLELHREYMIICSLFYNLQTCNDEKAINEQSEILEKYLTRCLPAGFYREFNADSMFRINTRFSTFQLHMIGDEDVGMVDISCNLRILSDLNAILTDRYMSGTKFTRRKPG
jgi:hypothetical protein